MQSSGCGVFRRLAPCLRVPRARADAHGRRLARARGGAHAVDPLRPRRVRGRRGADGSALARALLSRSACSIAARGFVVWSYRPVVKSNASNSIRFRIDWIFFRASAKNAGDKYYTFRLALPSRGPPVAQLDRKRPTIVANAIADACGRRARGRGWRAQHGGPGRLGRERRSNRMTTSIPHKSCGAACPVGLECGGLGVEFEFLEKRTTKHRSTTRVDPGARRSARTY